MKKILHIKNAYVNLPEDFNGTLADALFIFYQARIKSEQLNEISKKEQLSYSDFLNMNKKYCVSFDFLEN